MNLKYLCAFKEECIPDFKQNVTGQTLYKHHHEPVEGDEGHIHIVLFKMGSNPRQLLCHKLLKHTLVCLVLEAQRKKEALNVIKRRLFVNYLDKSGYLFLTNWYL